MAVKALGAAIGAGMLLPDQVLARTGEMLEGVPPKRRFFTKFEKRIVSAFSECVVPRTDTPGAIDAGVPGWVEILVEDCYSFNDQEMFRDGLSEINQAALDRYGKGFAALAYDDQVQMLTDWERSAIGYAIGNPGTPPAFIMKFKDLVKFVYVSTERGANEAFAYLPVPGRYDGAYPVTANSKVWAT
jgi:hypothetical protein